MSILFFVCGCVCVRDMQTTLTRCIVVTNQTSTSSLFTRREAEVTYALAVLYGSTFAIGGWFRAL